MENKHNWVFMKMWIGITTAAIFIFHAFTPLASAQMTHNYIGLSPSSIKEDWVLQNVPLTKTVNLQRDLDELPLTLEVTTRGEGSRYIQGPETTSFEVGERAINYEFQIVAEGAPNGDYQAYVSFLPTVAADFEGEGTGLSVKRGVTLIVNFTVTDEEFLEYVIVHEDFELTEVGEQISFTYTVNNTGNVDWRPDEIRINARDYIFNESVADFVIPAADIAISSPGRISDTTVSFDHDLDPGTYTLALEYIFRDEVVRTVEKTLTVYDRGTLNQQGELVSLTTNKTEYAKGENIKLEAEFKNTGELRVVGRLITEVYDKKGSLVEILTSDERSIDVGETAVFTDVFSLFDEGDYTVHASVEFANKVTQVLEVPIKVTSISAAIGSSSILLPVAIGLLSFTLMVIVGLLIVGRKKRKLKAVPPPVAKGPLPVPPSQSQPAPSTQAPPAQSAPAPAAPAPPATAPTPPTAKAAPVVPTSTPEIPEKVVEKVPPAAPAAPAQTPTAPQPVQTPPAATEQSVSDTKGISHQLAPPKAVPAETADLVAEPKAATPPPPPTPPKPATSPSEKSTTVAPAADEQVQETDKDTGEDDDDMWTISL